MGWLNLFEQNHTSMLYGKHAHYRCNNCGRLIWSEELAVVDPKGGYRRGDSRATIPNRYSRPKVTYCRECDAKMRGKVITYTVAVSHKRKKHKKKRHGS